MKRIFVKASILQKIAGVQVTAGALFLQKLLVEVFRRAIRQRIDEEIAFCIKNKNTYSHWLNQVLPERIATALSHPHYDNLLNNENTKNLANKLFIALDGNDSKYPEVDFYFEIVERYFLLRRFKKNGDEDLMEMIFYEHSEGDPDKNLQEILLKVLKEEVEVFEE
ncbi:MAG: hypothetical protein AAB497_04085 [Patescibacteria group bacterium]